MTVSLCTDVLHVSLGTTVLLTATSDFHNRHSTEIMRKLPSLCHIALHLKNDLQLSSGSLDSISCGGNMQRHQSSR